MDACAHIDTHKFMFAGHFHLYGVTVGLILYTNKEFRSFTTTCKNTNQSETYIKGLTDVICAFMPLDTKYCT